MKLISWNVNGLRSAVNKGFLNFLLEKNPDAICLQETKVNLDQLNITEFLSEKGYTRFWNPANKAGYSGTAIFTKIVPISHNYGLNQPKHDTEGRVVTLEYPSFYLVCVYVPNAQRDLVRLPYRLEWDTTFKNYLETLQKHKPIIVGGDLNVAHKEIDLANPHFNKFNPGFTQEERSSFEKLLNIDLVDSFRHFNQKPHYYTWWSYMHQARAKNIGWRIDYFLTSKSLLPLLESSNILATVHGSDHCPVQLELKLETAI